MKTFVLGTVQTNCYIISNKETKEAIVFDPADSAEKIVQYLNENDLVCKGILLTHGHFDHIMAAEELSEKTHASIYAHEAEAELLGNRKLNGGALFGAKCTLKPDVLLKDQETLTMAGFVIKVLHTPGHTVGGACYYFTEYETLISGDTLFYECIGRTDLPTGDGKVIVESIREQLMRLDDQVKVYPGHGKATTIGHEREYNYYINSSNDLFDL